MSPKTSSVLPKHMVCDYFTGSNCQSTSGSCELKRQPALGVVKQEVITQESMERNLRAERSNRNEMDEIGACHFPLEEAPRGQPIESADIGSIVNMPTNRKQPLSLINEALPPAGALRPNENARHLIWMLGSNNQQLGGNDRPIDKSPLSFSGVCGISKGRSASILCISLLRLERSAFSTGKRVVRFCVDFGSRR